MAGKNKGRKKTTWKLVNSSIMKLLENMEAFRVRNLLVKRRRKQK